MTVERNPLTPACVGLDMGVFSVKGVLLDGSQIYQLKVPTASSPVEAAKKCIQNLVSESNTTRLVKVGVMGQNAGLVCDNLDIKPLLELEALREGLDKLKIEANYVLSLGHESMHYLELSEDRQIRYFGRNGQCAAGSGAFWYQQATRMGFDDRQLADLALNAESAVPISGRCAVFAKSDMTHAINEGATQSAVSAGMAKALVDNILTGVAQNRIDKPGKLALVGGVANNKAIVKYMTENLASKNISVFVPEYHEFINAIGAAAKSSRVDNSLISSEKLITPAYKPHHPLPPLNPNNVVYADQNNDNPELDLSVVYLGVDCGSVSTKCVIVDSNGRQFGGVYLPTTGRPALQVLELMKQVGEKYGEAIENSKLIACTTGSGRFLSQNILNANYAVDEITCQAEGIKSLYPDEDVLSIIEIGGEDSKYIQLKNGILFDYNMNPVCAAGTGTFLENLAGLLNVSVKKEFSEKSFAATYAVDLGDICTLISQSILASASARGLPLNEQLASLAYSSAQNYISKTVDKRDLNGKLVFAGATAKNHALASALAAVAGSEIHIPAEPELTGALGSALMAKKFHQHGFEGEYTFRSLSQMKEFSNEKKACKAECKDEHNCMLNVISFPEGKKFIYGDRCGKYSSVDRSKKSNRIKDYASQRFEIMEEVTEYRKSNRLKIGIARTGLYYDYYPFWSAFWAALGCDAVLSDPTTPKTLSDGKEVLDSEMCYPMKVIVGHYRELSDRNPDYIFIPEVVSMEALPWATEWPKSFTCPLLQTLKGTVVNSLGIDPEKILYAQLNYRSGAATIKEQLRPLAEKIMGSQFSEQVLNKAIDAAYMNQKKFKDRMVEASEKLMLDLRKNPNQVPAVFLSRAYTLYDNFVSKNSMDYARQSGITAIPHEYLLLYLTAWYHGDIKSSILDPHREELIEYLYDQVQRLENLYPAQLQKMLSVVLLVNFLNDKSDITGLPHINAILLDPFKCGPNAMLRHYLYGLTSYLRLTLDEHTAAAGMITRLEAFKNTCLSEKPAAKKEVYRAANCTAADRDWKKILIPYPTEHALVFASLFKNRGVEAEVLPRDNNGDLSAAQRYANGEECLPFIQNLQDILSYLDTKNNDSKNGEVYFQGWACGPCRYGLYAPLQSLVVERAGYGTNKVCAVRFTDIRKRFGTGFLILFFNALLVMDLFYKMLHRVRPYEKIAGSADSVFIQHRDKLVQHLERYRLNSLALWNSAYRAPLENIVKDAAKDFKNIMDTDQKLKPRILLAGEFYVRLDDRCNQAVIKTIEKAGGEVCISPATELFSYTLHIDQLESEQSYKIKPNIFDYLKIAGYGFLLKVAHRDEKSLVNAAGDLLQGLEEPPPQEIREYSLKYVSGHYGGEPPMTIGRTAAFAKRKNVGGAVFVAPFTCMPASVVEAQQRTLQEDFNIPIITVYYDGKDNASRDEMVQGLVYQASQKVQKQLAGEI